MSEVLSLVGSGKNVYGIGQLDSNGDIINGSFECGMLLGRESTSSPLAYYTLVLRKSNGGYMGVRIKMNSSDLSAITCDIPEPTA